MGQRRLARRTGDHARPRRDLQGLRHPRAPTPTSSTRTIARAHRRRRSPASPGAARVLVGRDMRPSSAPLVAAFAEGVAAQGVDVVDLGLASTDLVYFAAGQARRARRRCSPLATTRPQYNGIKLCLAGAAPVGEDTGLAEIKAMVAGGLLDATADGRPARGSSTRRPARRVRRPRRARSSTSTRCGRCGSSPTPPTAWAASSCPRCSSGLPFDARVLYGELDGTFPNHPADPIQPENLKDLQRAVARRRRRRRPRVRRRRRPRVPRRRAGRGLSRLDHHRDRSPRRSSSSTRARRSCTT